METLTKHSDAFQEDPSDRDGESHPMSKLEVAG